ncbi:autotransporter assembly complex protein TamA [Lysobacter humi (ex Lee et al. 2017)]
MHAFPPRAALPLLALLAALPAQAVQIERVDIRGLDPAMTENVLNSLTLSDSIGDDVSERRLRYLLEEAEGEAREALEPFGYYDPAIRVTRTGAGIVIDITPGEPVRVRSRQVRIDGEAGKEEVLQDDLARFQPEVGEILDHVRYEASKARISRRLAERGYFDAELPTHRVEVTRAQKAADIELAWTSGARYRMGGASFTQTPKAVVYDRLLHKLVNWQVGEPYHQDRIERLRESLQRLEYFESIDVEPLVDKALDRQVPVDVRLTPAKRSIYTAGLSYGSDSGAGIRLSSEHRYVNMRGHKALASLDYAQKRKLLTLQYRIPAFAWLDGWYTFSLQSADEQTDWIDNRRVEFAASRSGQIDLGLTAVASIHVLRERWAYAAEQDDDPATPPDFRYASFTYPSIRAEYTTVDDRLLPRNGFASTVMLRGGIGTAGEGEDDTFVQAHGTVRWFMGLGERSRLILRAERGVTKLEAPIGALPPSLRFHAGGERSIRGYAWREVGPRVGDGDERFAIGARHVVTGSVEFESYLNDRWGYAVFADSGSAYNERPDWHTGVGFGVRWRSPVGPIRIDIARGLKNPDAPFQIYLGLGAEL